MIAEGLRILRRAEMALAIALLAVLSGVVFLGTVGRYAGVPVIWADEVAQAVFVWLALLAGDLTLQRAGHFRIDALSQLLPQPLRRALDLAINLMVAALLLLIVVYGWAYVEISHLRPLPMLQVPSSLATAALPVGCALMLVTLAEQSWRLATGRRLEVIDPPRDVT
ncbi:MAG: TRAP transporter small permease [Thalassobaculales bacterium]